ncbi:MAG TPA: DUF222 domain-containing protein, partial [Actinomycetes bacterium]|nr:DUF222 domain-containing protein [Actinomycetes bacterium]
MFDNEASDAGSGSGALVPRAGRARSWSEGTAWTQTMSLTAGQRQVLDRVLTKAAPVVCEGVVLPEWAGWSAGPALGAVLAGLDLGSLDEAGLVEALAAFDRQGSWCRAGQLAAITALAGRRAPAEPVSAPDGSGADWADRGVAHHRDVSEFLVQEVAARLAVSKFDAGARVGDALDLLGPGGCQTTFAALVCGVVDPAKAHVVAETVRGLDLGGEDVEDVPGLLEARLLPGTVTRTVRQARRQGQRLLLELDPGAAQERAEAARRRRRVILEPMPDSTAWLSTLLPAEDAVAVYTCLDLLARHRHAPGDPRGIDARRADALVQLITGHPLISGRCWCTGTCGGTHTSTCTGAGTTPGAGATCGSGAGAGCAAVPTDASRTPVGGIGASGRRKALVHLSVPALTLLGESVAPAWLHGYGYLPYGVAAAIAADATWRRLLTDPFTGTVIGAEVTQHDPPASMVELVNARYRECGFGPCTREAEACDLDHAIPYPDGPTSPSNLTPECRPEHRMCTLATGWRLARDDGGFVWISPTGHRYPIEPAQVGTVLAAIANGTYQVTPDEPPAEPGPTVDGPPVDGPPVDGQPVDGPSLDDLPWDVLR